MLSLPSVPIIKWEHPGHASEQLLLMTLAELVYNSHECLTKENIAGILELYTANANFYNNRSQIHKFTRGKYKLVLVLLMRYRFEDFNQLLQRP